MKKILRKLHWHELLANFITFAFLIAIGGCFLIYLIIKISYSTTPLTFDVRLIVVAAAGIFIVLMVAGISFYKLSTSYIRWYRGVLDSIPMPVIVTDKDAKWLQINKATRKVITLEQFDELGKLNSRHLLDADGDIMEKIWINNGTAYRVIGDRLRYDGKHEGYLILLNATRDIPDLYKTRTELINEINKLLARLSTASDHFHSCASTLVGCTVWQAGIINELTDVITRIALGEFIEADALNDKIYAVKTDMQQYAESSRGNLEDIKKTVKELDATRDSIDGMLNNFNSVS